MPPTATTPSTQQKDYIMFNIRQRVRGGAAVALLCVLGVLVLIGLASLGSYVSAANYGNATEQALSAKLNDNKNIRGNYTNQIAEMAQVPQMYRKDLESVIQKTFEGRYGKDGSRATWQWLQEQNPSLDPSLYARIQQAMESGRNEFKRSQTELLDQKRAYQTNLGYVWKGFWLRLAGYPKINLDDIKIVVANDTQQMYDSGVDHGVSIGGQ